MDQTAAEIEVNICMERDLMYPIAIILLSHMETILSVFMKSETGTVCVQMQMHGTGKCAVHLSLFYSFIKKGGEMCILFKYMTNIWNLSHFCDV